MAEQNPLENSLDLEFNNLIGRLGKVKTDVETLHREAENLSRKILSHTKRGNVSQKFKSAADRQLEILFERLNKFLK